MNNLRKKIYISHANPEDNIFSRWLSLKLMSFGYEVWSDVIQLELGVDFWRTFENEIRNNTKRFLFVASWAVKQKDNALRELAVAEDTRKSMNDNDPDKAKFMIAVRYTPDLPFGKIDPVLIRTNAADFSHGWAQGLAQVLEQFDKDGITRREDGNFERVKKWWNSVYSSNNSIQSQRELYSSNWFPIKRLPEFLRVYRYRARKKLEQADIIDVYPAARMFKNSIVTFASMEEVNRLLKTLDGEVVDNVTLIPVNGIISNNHETRFMSNKETRNILIELINKAWVQFFSRAGLNKYDMANGRVCHWIPLSDHETPHEGKGQLIGVQKYKHWHFGISGSTKLYPFPAISVRSHIVFTYDGRTIIEGTAIQHRSRRRQGRSWWNAHWRDKLKCMISLVSSGEGDLSIPVGEREFLVVGTTSTQFTSEVSYLSPDHEALLAQDLTESEWDDVEPDENEEE
ncbi:MAG: toll/interleukin-1 receptor domain-containing protein [Bacteroidetes bacterium]|nr:toll/interleukin-1 receptor domain-containing protein [Bacteroidota bacterium]